MSYKRIKERRKEIEKKPNIDRYGNMDFYINTTNILEVTSCR